MNKTDILSLRLDPNVRARLELVANEDGTTPSTLVRRLIESHINGRHENLGRYSRLLSKVDLPADEPAESRR